MKVHSVLGRSVAGPFLLGLVFGGLPSAVVLSRLSGRIVSPEFFRFLLFLTPIWVLVSATVAALGPNGTPKRIFGRALFASIGACIPVPSTMFLVLAWPTHGAGSLAPASLPTELVFLFVWALAVAVAGWLLALAYRGVKRRLGWQST
jgi:hypothetical protein